MPGVHHVLFAAEARPVAAFFSEVSFCTRVKQARGLRVAAVRLLSCWRGASRRVISPPPSFFQPFTARRRPPPRCCHACLSPRPPFRLFFHADARRFTPCAQPALRYAACLMPRGDGAPCKAAPRLLLMTSRAMRRCLIATPAHPCTLRQARRCFIG